MEVTTTTTKTITTTTTQAKYTVYNNGDPVYYNSTAGEKCDAENAVSTTGTKSGCMKFYAFNDEGEYSPYINLILDHNTTPLVAWNSTGSNTEMKEVKEYLGKDTTGWIVAKEYDGLNARLITADEVAEITGAKEKLQWTSDKTFVVSTNIPIIGETISMFYLDGERGTNKYWQTQVVSTKGASAYAWLFDNTHGCTSYGCNVNDDNKYAAIPSGTSDYIWAYWTSTPTVGNSDKAWDVDRYSHLDGDSVDNDHCHGVRPVITVSKSVFK